ncbi:hypothetical protein SAMN05660909_00398 [Chitinophaga terrae (ex Kim and Jung 2007)]|uniref:Uncharacterized protein n=1 Tax=Chitinophaga terrae (ex Kim and Jung 2007) TaxID=408074 RepID=A0A1H3XFM5_9BACT|nr:hypothetical protein [Chitinophaga terrae (ex Kim and Jung 2007)]MDQ0108877.1 hypothetical protein [Chitinophaga terrae (ex Kim and Jung 2007)]SDZ97358.1 hypothetical protein SAMN05660909_00398 [Chitinophaga terrae (ex Kim and Jung 2007)]
MMLKNGYKYFFYKMYRFAENAPSRWWSEWKATLSLSVLEIMLLMSLEGYFSIIFKNDIVPGDDNFVTITQAVVIGIFNYYFFLHKDKWKMYVKELDKQSRRQQFIGGLVVWSLVFLIFANLVFMFYLMSRINWSLYR